MVLVRCCAKIASFKIQSRCISSALIKTKTLIDGQWVSAKSNATFDVTNPADNSVITSVPNLDVEDAKVAVEAAHRAFKSWGFDTIAKERSALLNRWANLCLENKDELAKILTAEMGKPLAESTTEIMYGTSYLEWYAQEARRITGDIIPTNVSGRQLFHYKEPIGVAALITPWNFPSAMISRKIGAALAVGCTCIIKPAEDTPLSALALAHLAEKAGFPKGVINVITSDRNNTAKIGKFLCESEKVAAISFTGSTTVGKILLQQSATTVKKVCLELGGNAPFIVFESADLDRAVAGALASKFRATGQTCVCANRFFIQSGIYDQFIKKLTDAIRKQLVVGDGSHSGVTLGPLINKRAIEKVDNLINDAVKKGAKLIIGGVSHEKGENFYEPTLLCDATPDMSIVNEEIFGPVATIVKFDTEDQVLQMANNVRAGLAGYFYSKDVSQIFRVARRLEVGMVGINEGIISACEVGFGGVKESGLGREGGHLGIDDFTNVKYVCLGGLT